MVVVKDFCFFAIMTIEQSKANSLVAHRYDPHTNLWSADVAPTNTCRTSVGVAVLDSFLYAVGGQDGVTCLNLVERYDSVINKWTKVLCFIILLARRLFLHPFSPKKWRGHPST
ncbi:unnamed protein product [Dibothriocephalus latus]|uniref:Kelch repeat protein n=1 Tax=Dibothriocephalus latus TaxID=60516 RepID=A0A3P7M2A9_DIBLA|nr:unnamed protein product [Dibothriocephalus latus]